ncbi:hypothetical protein VNO78_37388 [Psophocarpus tetragonolobus]|uniref:Cytochrome P450 n=1 Tax=Psophocarpus tetragonolobus TaxID=3891 RepID=A0AAN9NCS8_PSOTE
MELLFWSAAEVSVVTVMIAMITLWAVRVVNWVWLRPKRFEKLLREQGLNGEPYSLSFHKSIHSDIQQDHTNSPPFPLSDHVAPCVSSSVHRTIAKHGKNSFVWEGTIPTVIITDPNQIKEVFNNIHDFHKLKFSGITKLFVNGLLTYEGEKWAKHRRITTPAFRLEKLKNMLPAFSQSCHDMISTWKGILASDGKCEIDLWPFFRKLTSDVISRTAFGSSYAEGEKIFQLLQMQGYLVTTSIIENVPALRYIPTTTKRRMLAMEREVHDLIEAIIKKREKAMKNGEAYNEDLLTMFLESNDMEIRGHENSRSVGMTNQEVIEECKLFYTAGQETTSILLCWTMVLLARYPQWQARAREEVFQVFGHQNLHFDGLSQLKIMTMILYEVLRLYPPSIFFTRTLQKDVKLGNVSLPAGIHITMPILFVHQNEDIWGDDAKEFKPERFSEGIAKATNKGQVSFYPFGWGPRICIAQNFALLEAKIVFSLLLQHFSFELSPSYAHHLTFLLGIQPKHGAHIVLHKL